MSDPSSTDISTSRENFRAFGSDGLTRLPGLDGLRGFAVLAVVLFHGGFGWAKGGYLGVSLFFTLSGFLITSLILANTSAEKAIPKGFWVARAKRLWPAAWLTILLALSASWFLDEKSEFLSNRGDALASLLQVANWRLIIADTSYGELFSAPSPFLHFWSLAIEEQFYLVFPFLIAALATFVRRSQRAGAGVLLGAAVVSWLLPVIANFGNDRTYFGTDARAGELLLGAALAIWLSNDKARVRLSRRLNVVAVFGVLGVIALMVTLVGFATVEQQSPIFENGGFVLVSGISALLIVAAAIPTGPVGALTHLAPLRWFGKISYGLYLFHWPIFVYVTEDRLGFGGVPLFVVTTSIAVGAAALSHTYFETPIRKADISEVFTRRRLLVGLAASLAVLLPMSLFLPAKNSDTGIDFESAEEEFDELTQENRQDPIDSEGDPATGDDESGDEAGSEIPRVGVYGDSVALTIGIMLLHAPLEKIEIVGGNADLGCSLVRGGLRLYQELEPQPQACDQWPEKYPEAVRSTNADMALITSGQWEIVDRVLPGETEVRVIGDPELDAVIESEFLAATDVLSDAGAKVVWLTLPYYGDPEGGTAEPLAGAGHDPARVDRLNEIIRDVAEQRPDTVRIVDIAAFIEPQIFNTDIRNDGSHYVDDPNNPAIEFLEDELAEAWKSFED